MRKYIVSIVGRPNVGKSTLFNRLSRKRSAIVDFEAGVTRDRKYEDVEWCGKVFKLVDTGGIIFDSKDSIDRMVKHQVMLAIDESDLILFMVDAETGATGIDQEIARMLYPHRDKVLIVANKVDNEKREWELYDFLSLGFGEAFAISALQGRNTGNFLDEVIKMIPQTSDIDWDEVDKKQETVSIAVVGKPNVGKSSIVNKLLGNDRQIVTEIPGTTRDSIDTSFRYMGEEFILVDTAGLRRKTRIDYGVEYFSSMRTIDAIDRASIVIIVIAADEPVSDQDQKIAAYAKRKNKEIIIAVNKWDLVTKDNSTTKTFILDLHEKMPFLQFAPVLFISAKTGQRLNKIMETVVRIETESRKRIPTAELNKFMEKVIEKRPPTHSTGQYAKIYYITQATVRPPTFIFFCNKPYLISENYRRYVHNQLREMFEFEGVSIKMIFKGKKDDDTDL